MKCLRYFRFYRVLLSDSSFWPRCLLPMP